MLAAKCYECHNADKMKGDVDLKKFAANPDVPVHAGLAKFLKEHKAWDDKWKIATSGS